MTINAHCTDTAVTNTEDGYGMEQETRAFLMSDRIAGINPDIFAIVDCFQNSAKDAYVQWLGSIYPSRIEWLNNTWDGQDSGMMLFSKFPFLPFDNPYFPPDVVSDFIDGVNNNVPWDQSDGFVAWHYLEGDQLVGVDAMAAKMVAMVRIHTPTTELDGAGRPRVCPVNVAVTHLQADYGDDDGADREEHQDARESSLLQTGSLSHASAELMFRSTLTTAQQRGEAVFLLGDLNIDGNFGEYQVDQDGNFILGSDGYPLGDPTDFRPLPRCRADIDGDIICGPQSEWDDIFGQSDETGVALGIFYKCGFNGFKDGTTCFTSSRFFTDAWAFEHPRTDVLQTTFDDPSNQSFRNGENEYFTGTRFDNRSDGFRLDYILHNQPEDAGGSPYLCMQHVQRMWWDIGDAQYDDANPPHIVPDSKNLSDHLSVFADVSFERADNLRCNPKLRSADGGEAFFGSEEIVWGTDQDVVRNITIDYNRDHSWFFIDRAGSYSIGVETLDFDDVDIDVYHNSDLSGPIDAFHQEAITIGLDDFQSTLKPYAFIEPPYYVRITNKATLTDFSVPKALKVTFREHRCTNPNNDYCMLVAGDGGVTVGWPTNKVHSTDFDPTPACDPNPGCNPSDPDHVPECDPICCEGAALENNETFYGETADGSYDGDYMFFVFGVDKHQETHPTVEFEINFDDPTHFDLDDPTAGRGAKIFDWKNYDMKRRDHDAGGTINTVLMGYALWSEPSPGTYILNMQNDVSHELSPHGDADYRGLLLRVNRNVPLKTTPTLVTMSIQCRESLKKVRYAELIGYMTDDEPSDVDEIALQMRVDSEAFGTCGAGSWDPPFTFAYLDDGGDQEPIGYDTYFTVNVKARMCEIDMWDYQDDHYAPDLNASFPGNIPPSVDGKHRPPHIFTDDPNVSWADSEYHHHLKYVVKNEELSTAFEGGDGGLTCP